MTDRELLEPVGERYGMLLVLSESDKNARGKRRFLCRCDRGAAAAIGAGMGDA